MGADQAVVAGGAAQPRNPDRKRVPDRQVLCGILFVLHTGSQWEFLPQELGFGSGMTCWTRLRDWNEAGVWSRLHEALLTELHSAGRLDWDRAVVDTSHMRAARRRAEPERLRIRWGHRDDIHEALPGLATRIICYRHVRRFRQDRLIRGRRLKVTPTPPVASEPYEAGQPKR